MDKKLQPRLRFRGFTDPWQQRKLGEVAEIFGGGTPDSKNRSYWNGTINWFTPSEVIGRRYVDISQRKITKEGLSHSSATLLPRGTILFTSRTSIGNAAFLTNESATNQGFQSLLINEKAASSNFIFAYCPLIKLYSLKHAAGSTFLEINARQLAKCPVIAPSLPEQSRVGEFFKTLDDLIAAEERKKDLLEQKKKAYLQKIFSQELRFKGFNEPWQRRRLGSFFEVNNERNGNLFSYNKIISVSSMTYRPPERGSAANSLQSYKVIRIGDLAFDGNKHKNRPFGHLNINNLGEGLMTPRFTAFRPKGRIEISYWKQYVENDYLMRKILSTSTQKGTLMNEIVVSDFLKKVILIPTVEEQALIGNLFKLLDDQISSQQRKVDLLKRKKKAYLQQMFV